MPSDSRTGRTLQGLMPLPEPGEKRFARFPLCVTGFGGCEITLETDGDTVVIGCTPGVVADDVIRLAAVDHYGAVTVVWLKAQPVSVGEAGPSSSSGGLRDDEPTGPIHTTKPREPK